MGGDNVKLPYRGRGEGLEAGGFTIYFSEFQVLLSVSQKN